MLIFISDFILECRSGSGRWILTALCGFRYFHVLLVKNKKSMVSFDYAHSCRSNNCQLWTFNVGNVNISIQEIIWKNCVFTWHNKLSVTYQFSFIGIQFINLIRFAQFLTIIDVFNVVFTCFLILFKIKFTVYC